MEKQYYQSILLQHYKNPVGLDDIPDDFAQANGSNPLCGDEICVGVKVENGLLTDIRFKARACSICIASTSIMVELLRQQPASQAAFYHAQVLALLKREQSDMDLIESLQPLATIVANPSRHKCTLLGWEALLHALTT